MKLAKRRFLVFRSSWAAGIPVSESSYGYAIRWGWYPYGFGKRPNVKRSRK